MKTYSLNQILKTSLAVSAIAAVAGIGASAQAMETSTANNRDTGYIGVLAGGNSPTSSGANTTTTFGATMGAKLTPAFGIGLFGSYYGQTSTGSFLGLPTGTATSTYVFTGQGNFFSGGLHLGGEVGPAFSSWSGNVSTLHAGTNASALVFGPEAGYDFSIAQAVSIGAEAHYLFSNANSGVNNIQFFAALKVWL